jgi:rhamnose transport system permease protein
MNRHRRELSIFLAWLGVLAVVAVGSKSGGFFGSNEVRNNLVAAAPVLVLAVGMTLVIIARQIDISVGAQISVCGVVFALVAKEGIPVPLAAVVAVGLGTLFGLVNGWLVAGVKLPSIVVSLATLVILREGLRYWREGIAVQGLPGSFQWFGFDPTTGPWLVTGVAVLVFLAFVWGMRYVAAGRAVYATGSDAEAARLTGIRPDRVTLGVFAVMGGLSGLAAVLSAVRSSTVDADLGKGLELQVIAAVVVGGTAVSGGRGTLVGTLLGVLLLATVRPGLIFLDVPAQWEKAIQGLIILVAVASDAAGRKGGSRE